MNTRYLRKGQTITTIETDVNGNETKTSKDWGSNNKAKRESRRLQEKTGVLGNGVLIVI